MTDHFGHSAGPPDYPGRRFIGRTDSAADGGATVRMLIATDVRLYEVGLRRALDGHSELDVIGTAGDRSQALARTHDLAPDVVLLDMAMEGSLDIARALTRSTPRSHVVAFAVSESDDDVLACAEAGVAGYVTRDGSLEQLIAVLRYVARGELLCSPRIAGSLLRHVARSSIATAPDEGDAGLTAREREVARLVARGLSNKEVARELQIQLSTVKNHVHHLLEKLRINRRGKLVAALHRS
jgi:Response regulator containing a CheY-like receiver domain and an HTH DNA-binding domain